MADCAKPAATISSAPASSAPAMVGKIREVARSRADDGAVARSRDGVREVARSRADGRRGHGPSPRSVTPDGGMKPRARPVSWLAGLGAPPPSQGGPAIQASPVASGEALAAHSRGGGRGCRAPGWVARLPRSRVRPPALRAATGPPCPAVVAERRGRGKGEGEAARDPGPDRARTSGRADEWAQARAPLLRPAPGGPSRPGAAPRRAKGAPRRGRCRPRRRRAARRG